jgi:hypothetical protein
MSVALVHIGTHKTGTTSFQGWANRHRDELLDRHGIHVFRGRYMESNLALPMLCARPNRTTPPSVAHPEVLLTEGRADLQAHVASEVAHPAPILLASAEDLCLLRYPDEVERLAELFGPREIHVAACLRDPDEYLRSYRGTMDRIGQPESPYPSAHTYYGPDTWLTRWDEMLATWREVLGEDRVVATSYEEAMQRDGSSIPAILRAFDLPVEDLPPWEGHHTNVSTREEQRQRWADLYWQARHTVGQTKLGQVVKRRLRG